MNWLWIFLPVALVVIAAVVGLPLWQSIWAREENEHQAALDRHDRVRHEATRPDATPQSRPQHVRH
ncbi:MAG: hypothetical protein ACRDPO_09485 [Streptosporangiaceae bacterium]